MQHNAWKKVKVSPVSHLFMMQIVTQIKCCHCGYLRHTYDDTSNIISVALLSNKCTNLEVCFRDNANLFQKNNGLYFHFL